MNGCSQKPFKLVKYFNNETIVYYSSKNMFDRRDSAKYLLYENGKVIDSGVYSDNKKFGIHKSKFDKVNTIYYYFNDTLYQELRYTKLNPITGTYLIRIPRSGPRFQLSTNDSCKILFTTYESNGPDGFLTIISPISLNDEKKVRIYDLDSNQLVSEGSMKYKPYHTISILNNKNRNYKIVFYINETSVDSINYNYPNY